jgi:transcriptional antiterminator RfaH
MIESTTESRTPWIALFAKPRHEWVVARALEARGAEVFVPSLEVHGKRGTLLHKPFFPRYLFASFRDGGAGTFPNVQWTPGLSRVVTFDGRPAWLDGKQVDYLRERLGAIDGDAFLSIKVGDVVRVTEGPFRDMEAIFDGHLNGAARVAILLGILGRQTRVIVGSHQVESVA